MKMSRFSRLVFGGMFVVAMHVASAHAQTRTWVSGLGDDANACSRTAPCKTFAGALSKTAAGGEISVLDAAGYGAVTIDRAITINGEGTQAGVLVSSGAAITVAAGVSDRVILRNIMINGAGGGTNGVLISNGNVTIDKCFIFGFTTADGIGIYITASYTNVDIRDTNITNSTAGVLAQPSFYSHVRVSFDNVRINDAPGYGVVVNNASMWIRNSYINNTGNAAISATGSSAVTVEHTLLTSNGTAISAGDAARIVINDNSMYGNQSGLAIASGATVATANNNKSFFNGPGAAPNGNISIF
jgi:hypothetical protein